MILNILDDRSSRVLYAVVESYINKPEPVGSRFVTKKYSFGFSSATIRNIMADLEEIGFLSQPHTSAGRVPTDRGYRYYVDSLLNLEKAISSSEMPREFMNQFSKRLEQIKDDISGMFSEVTSTLSSISNYVSIALPPKTEKATLNRINFIKYKGDHAVAILLTDEGIIKNRIFKIDPMVKQEDLNRITDYLNSEYAGYALDEIRSMLIQSMKREKAQWDKLISRAINIFEQALSFTEEDVFVSGLDDAMNLPDFSDISKIRELSKAIKDKHVIIKLLDELSDAEGVRVMIGNENPVNELKGLSVVAATYKEGNRPMGIIALIGPTRMNYSKAISMVDVIAKCVGRTFDDRK